MKLHIYEVFDAVRKARQEEDKVRILKENYTGAVYDILKGSLDPNIEWLLPQGSPPPYTPNKPESIPSALTRQCQKLAYLVKGGKGGNLSQIKRESIFIELLEAIHPEDAKIVINMVNKIPPKGITKELVNKAFPGLLT